MMPQSVGPKDRREGRTSSRASGVRAKFTTYLNVVDAGLPARAGLPTFDAASQLAIAPEAMAGLRRVSTRYISATEGVSLGNGHKRPRGEAGGEVARWKAQTHTTNLVRRRSCSHSSNWQMKPGFGEIVLRCSRARV